MMNIAAALVLGILIGWLAEWIMDWFYWRGRIRSVASENADLSQKNTNLGERIAALEQESQKKRPSLDLKFLTDNEGNDNFQLIKGIGPAFSKRLRDAGIKTFEQLAELTSAQMEEILGTLFKRFFAKGNNILVRAKEFAQLKAQAR